MKSIKGFTLIEIMIVAVIVSIIGSIAYPQYLSYVQKARRSDAISALLQMMQVQERYFNENYTYSTTLSNLGYTTDSNGKVKSSEGIYLLSAKNCVTETDLTYCVNLLAEPQGVQASDGNIELNSYGEKTPSTHW